MEVSTMSVAQLQDLVSRIDVEARKVNPRRAALTLVAGVFFVVGLVVGLLFKAVWSVISWSIAAVKVGFKAGRDVSLKAKAGGG